MTKLLQEIEKCTEVLKNGGIIIYPTDTVWGIGCDATNPDAVAAVYALKRRSDSKSMLALTDSTENLKKWVSNVPKAALEYIEDSSRPTTVIYSNPLGLASNLLAEDGSVGIRISNENFSRELCRRFGRPIVSTSANISGRPAPVCFPEIEEEVLKLADYVVEYRRDDLRPAAPSRIIKINPSGETIIIRN